MSRRSKHFRPVLGAILSTGSSVPWGHRDSVDEEGKEECRRDLGTTLAPGGGKRSGKVSIDLCLPAGGFLVLPGPRLNSCPPSEQDAPSRSLVPPCDRDTNCACPRLTSLVGIHLLLKLRQSHTSATLPGDSAALLLMCIPSSLPFFPPGSVLTVSRHPPEVSHGVL